MCAMDAEPDRRRRRLGAIALTALWCAAAAVSVGVGFGAVHLVGQNVGGDSPRLVSGGELPAPTSGAPTTAPPATTSAKPSPTRTASTRPRPPRTGEPAAPASTKTVFLRGGTVAVRCSGSSASLLYATPADGYRVKIEGRGPHEVEVEFEADGKSRLKAYCAAGRVQAEVRED
jgi:hypothetical protein